MEKIAIVIQRYGKKITGGAEFHARYLAEHLRDSYEVEILTTCSQDAHIWDNYYPKGQQKEDDITVIRFESAPKNRKRNRKLFRYLYKNLIYSKKELNWCNFINKLKYKKKKDHDKIFEEWIKEQGPYCEDLVEYIANNSCKYITFIFFTYLYYPTYVGITRVSHKAIFIPTAHDELAFYLSGFNKLFSQPRFIMYDTASEKKLVESIYPQTRNIKSDIAGIGFDIPKITDNNTLKLIPNYKYFVYIGRFEKHKGVYDLIDWFEYFVKSYSKPVKLIMIGKNHTEELKTSENIIFTGFISEQEKLAYLKNSEALVIPSRYESLSMVTMEAMAIGKPVLANGRCEVLKNHIDSSKAGFLYSNKKEFCTLLNFILMLPTEDRNEIAKNGIAYIKNNYKWSIIIDKFEEAISI